MSGANPFGFTLENPFANEPINNFEDEHMLESLNNFEWDIPEEPMDEKNIFAPEQDFPLFNLINNEMEQVQNFKVEKANQVQERIAQEAQIKIGDTSSEAGVKLVDEKEAEVSADIQIVHGLSSTEKSDNSSSRRLSTDNCDSMSDAKSGSDEDTIVRITNVPVDLQEIPVVSTPKIEAKPKMEAPKTAVKEDPKKEEDPDFCYKAPRKQKFEYNKRKDVILKTILRKCRRILQDDFNELTGYFSNRKMQGHQFLKDCIQKYHDSLTDKPMCLDLLFYLGAILYPQEMSRGVDCFFDSDKKERVKQRKFYRAKIQKVHDVLYRYSHEKMDYFVNVPELSYLYTIFYKKGNAHEEEDQYYMNGATEIFERCKETLELAGISV